ncbi:MAG: hypothetical protein NTV06_00650, partial [candidate division Zixibacteria bacterium]|nr:hypothetical protein [candidate division Zixibacteria bacterium]
MHNIVCRTIKQGENLMTYRKMISAILVLMVMGVLVMADGHEALAEDSLAVVKEAPTRAQIDAKYKWKLEDLYPTDEVWEKTLGELKDNMQRFKNFEGKLGSSSDYLAECLILNDSLTSILHRLIVYSGLKKDEDNRVGKYMEMVDRASTVASQFNQLSAYIEPEIIAISDDTLKSYINTNPKLGLYRFYIEDLIRRKAHIMSTEVENILAMTGNVTRGFGGIFSMIDDADIKYPSIKDENGNLVELTKERFSIFLESTDRRVRKDASDAYTKAYFAYQNTLGATLSSS